MFIHSVQHGPSQAIFSAIKIIIDAKKSVILSTYYLEGQGIAGKCLMDALTLCQAPEIKILTNHHFLELSKTQSYLKLFACSFPNIEVRSWNHAFMNSNHAKFIIVDDEICSLGGYNFQEALFMEEGPWSDLGIIVHSNVLAKKLRVYFQNMWKLATPILCDTNEAKRKYPNSSTCPPLAKGRQLFVGKEITSVTFLSQTPSRWFLHTNKSQAFLSILDSFQSARHTIDILCPNVIDTCLWSVLKNLEKSVQIRILTNRDQNVLQSGFSLLEPEHNFLKRKQKELTNVEMRFSNHSTKKTKLKTDGREWPHLIDHSKYYEIDGKDFYIGSFNLDPMSLHACGEIGIIVHNEPDVSKEIHEFLFEYCWERAIPFFQ